MPPVLANNMRRSSSDTDGLQKEVEERRETGKKLKANIWLLHEFFKEAA